MNPHARPLAFFLCGTIMSLASNKWRTTVKKTVLTLILIAALVLSLAACGSAPAAQPQENAGADEPLVTDAPQQSLEADAEQPAAEATEAPAPSETEVAVNTMTAYRAGGEPVILKGEDGVFTTEDGTVYYLGNDGMLRAEGFEDLYINDLAAKAAAPEDAAGTAPVIERQDGERFEAVIVMEGMEETVNYEHIRNEALGFEMDYDYESFRRYTDAERERFVSTWDDPGNIEDYMDVTRSAEDAETVAAALTEELSRDFELTRVTRKLERAGSCIRIEASVIKGTNQMTDQLQAFYIIPAPDGCRIATTHAFITESEGFFWRFDYMLNTLSVIAG